MNFQVNKNQDKKWLKEDIIPIIVLLQCWKNASSQLTCETDVIFVILQAIQRICSAENKSLTELIDNVKEQCGEPLAAQYVSKLNDVGSSLYAFMSVFDDVKKLLYTSDVHDGIVDVDMKGSIFGLFITRCHVEFTKLTFTQTKRIFLSYKNYIKETLDRSSPDPRPSLEEVSLQMKALEKHLHSMDYHKTLNLLHKDINSSNISLTWLLCQTASVTDDKSNYSLYAVGMATLLLSAIQRQFGHHTEATNSLRETIMLAQEEQFDEILDYAVLWLQQFHGNDSNDVAALLKHLSHHVHVEKLHNLQWWANLRLANQKLSSCSTPLSCIATLQNQLKDLMTADYKVVDTSTVVSTTCAFQTVAWQQYGFSTISLLSAQMQAHMMSHEMASIFSSHDILGLRGQQAIENMSESLCCLAQHLFKQAHEDDALRLLTVAIDHISSCGYTAKVDLYIYELIEDTMKEMKNIQHCRQELVIKRAVVRGRVKDAEEGVASLKALDSQEANYWMAVVCTVKGNLPDGFKLATELLENVRRSKSFNAVYNRINLEARLLLLLSRLLGDHLGQLGPAMVQIQQCITLCDRHHLGMIYPEVLLYWAQLHLQVGSHEKCMSTLMDCMIKIKANGSILEQSTANFLLAQALYMKSTSCQEQNHHKEVLLILDEAVSGFEQCQAVPHLKQSLFLQAQLYGEIGSIHEQERIAQHILELN